MKIINKQILATFTVVALLALIVGCGPTSNPTSEPTSIAPTSSPTTELPEPFSPEVEANLVHEDDYLEHSKTYNGKNYQYDPYLWYVNELDGVPLPDPHVFVEDGTYYITGTSDRSGCSVIDCYVTTDFIDYKLEKIYIPADYDGWENSKPVLYAPEMYCFDGVYYLYYSAVDKNEDRFCSVVMADNPLGPYQPIVNDTVNGLNGPLLNKGDQKALDTTIFVDDDGKIYMYYAVSGSPQYCAGVEMINPYTPNWDTYRELVKPGELSSENNQKLLSWEIMRKRNIAEAPFMIKSKDKYYLTYSANGCWDRYYNVCYAVSDSPLGNFVKPYEEGKIWTNMLLGYPGMNEGTDKVSEQWDGFASGPGHHCFFNIGDKTMIGYHAHRNRSGNNGNFTERYFAFDYVHFDEDGVPFINGPTWSPQPLPKELSSHVNIAENATIRVENVTNESAINDNYIIDCYNLEDGSKEVKLGAGRSYIELTFDKPYRIGGIAIYNSAYYENAIYDVSYVDFGNGNAIKDLTFMEQTFVSHAKEFVFPNSAFTVEYYKNFTSDKVVISFDLAEGGSINEIVVLGR